MAQGSPAEEQQ
jgi:hypothetical protein